MFKRRSSGTTITFTLDGKPIQACEGDSIAAAILASDEPHTRKSLISSTPRTPYCMMGVCFECLVEVDGIGYQQACMLPVCEGLTVRRHAITQQAHWS